MLYGDYTNLAKMYNNRPAYNYKLLKFLSRSINPERNSSCRIADIGAGTGKLTKMLGEMGYNVFAVEPNDAMRSEGINYTKDFNIKWFKGTAENTGLNSGQFDWIFMASSFHWTNHDLSLPEFHRILKPNGYLTIIWNPRNIQDSQLHVEIEQIIYDEIPNLKRKSSGNRTQTEDWANILKKGGYFKDVIYLEFRYNENMSHERYMKIWKSVNDIRVQAGEDRFNKILKKINTKIDKLDILKVPYLNTCWTAQRTDLI